jgi:hypothetical protein
MSTAAKRIGRPVKPPEPGKRAPLSLLIRPALKECIEKLAEQNGRTLAAEAEHLIEQGLAAGEMLGSRRMSLPKQAEQAAEDNFRRRGYTWIHTSHGKIWLPPGMPGGSHSVWLPPEEQGDK